MKLLVLLSLLLTSSALSAQNSRNDILGTWITDDSRGLIKIFEKDGKYFGRLVWAKDSADANGKLKKDVNNPDPKKRNRNVLNLVILGGFSFDDGEWSGGIIYDPETGNTYKAYMTMSDKNTLNLRGYVGISVLGRTTTWKRKVK